MLNKECLIGKNSIRPWENPQLTTNGTLGGDTFACTCTGDKPPVQENPDNGFGVVWHCFDKNESTPYMNRCGSGANINYLSITIYSPNPIMITYVKIVPAYWGFNSGVLQNSIDGSTWNTICNLVKNDNDIPSTSFYQYWKFANLAGTYSGGWRNVHISEIYLKGYTK